MSARKKATPRNTESADDYLKAIFHLGGAERRIGTNLIAARLDIAAASVTNMMQKLAAARQPFLDYQRHRGVQLSERGRRRALEIVRHHRLIETFLHRVLGYPINEELHNEAERLEHFISETFEARIDAVLGHPTADPHGHCIPAMDGAMPPEHRLTCKCP